MGSPRVEHTIDRAIPNERLRWLILAIQSHMGDHGLRMMLRQAGMDHYIERLPPDSSRAGPKSSEYSHLLATVRRYFGRGARGTLIRIGREAFRQQLSNRRGLALAKRTTLSLTPIPNRMRWMLAKLAEDMSAPDGHVEVEESGGNLRLADHTYDRTYQVSAEEPICWSATGEISEALLWATGQDHTVLEVDCRAAGDECCRFSVV